MNMNSKALGHAIALGLLTLAAAACPAEPDPGTPTDDSSSSTTFTTFPDECGTGGGSNDYCCQFNSNYCDSDTETDTDGTTTSTTIPDDCGTGGGSNDYCCQFNSNYCDSDTETDTTVPETDTEPMPPDTDTDGTLAGCECILDEEGEGAEPTIPSLPSCGEPLCGDVSGSCDGSCDESPFELAYPEALECALVALRDRTPGILTWSWSGNAGQYDDDGYVLINADGTVVRRNWGWSDLSYQAERAELGELPPAEHFDACLADPDDLARFDCMRAELDSMLGVCDEGWSHSKG
jgi:hypothetical protein